ncbi:MAG: hypothetical protein ABF289_18045 [Clostridiales bacterium]
MKNKIYSKKEIESIIKRDIYHICANIEMLGIKHVDIVLDKDIKQSKLKLEGADMQCFLYTIQDILKFDEIRLNWYVDTPGNYIYLESCCCTSWYDNPPFKKPFDEKIK